MCVRVCISARTYVRVQACMDVTRGGAGEGQMAHLWGRWWLTWEKPHNTQEPPRLELVSATLARLGEATTEHNLTSLPHWRWR